MTESPDPLCPHFGVCGGCQWQDRSPGAYTALKIGLVRSALERHGLTGAELRAPITVPPRSRRRATLHALGAGGQTQLGFHVRESHQIADMTACLVLTPALFAAVAPLRALLGAVLKEGETASLHLSESDGGLDLDIEWKRALKPALVSLLADAAGRLTLARVTCNGQIAVSLAPATVALGPASVRLPPRGFLQPTRAGEAALQGLVLAALGKAKRVADLFSGAGTFAFVAGARARVHAVESDPALLAALNEGLRHAKGLKPLTTERRDLFKLPVSGPELKAFDAVVLDPPRAGAIQQARVLAASSVPMIAYVSCNPASFARDARTLIDGGYQMGPVTPVDQFLWSEHIELMAAFSRL